MANYIPVLDGPVFLGGLVVFALGVGVLVLRSLLHAPALGLAFDGGGALRFGLNASVVATAVGLLAFAWSWLALPTALAGRAYYEILFWGGGHALQFTWTLLMLVAWLWLASASGALVRLSPRLALAMFGLALLAVFVTPYAYLAHDIAAVEQYEPWFVQLNPNSKLPVIVDAEGPEGKPFTVFESGAILVYLAEKTGRFLGSNAAERSVVLQWLMLQMGGIGPMFGQVGFFHKFAGKDYEDKRPRDRYVQESTRLLRVLEQRLDGRAWIMGEEYTIADIASFPWINNLVGFYGAGDLVGWANFPNVQRVLTAFLARPAVQRGLKIPARPAA